MTNLWSVSVISSERACRQVEIDECGPEPGAEAKARGATRAEAGAASREKGEKGGKGEDGGEARVKVIHKQYYRLF